MPIQRVEQQLELPLLGAIRLGIRKQAQSGALYPTTVEHFVLTDAPEVAKVYGDDPKELDIMFPSDDLEQIIPTWLKWYGQGVKGRDGQIIGGKLLCYGDGPDVSGNPGTAHYLAKRDPLTRVVPTRPCLGEACPDARDAKGNPQCKPTMRILCMLPLVSLYGVYKIDTTSWRSIRSFMSQLLWIKNWNQGVIKAIPLKLIREETATTFFDPKTGEEKNGKQYIMYLKPNEEFAAKHGHDVQKKLQDTFNAGRTFMLPSAQALIESPMEDHFPVIDGPAQPEQIQASAPDPVSDAERLIADSEIASLFDQLEKVTGKQFSKKARIVSVRKKEGEADMRGAVIRTLTEALEIEKAKQVQPAQSGDGIM